MSLDATAPTSALAAAPRRRGLPLLGALPGLLRRRFDYLEELRRREGDIYALDLPGAPIVACHPAHAQHILRDRAANYRKGGGFWAVLRELLGDGIIVSEGDRWLRQRRLMQPQFHRQRIAAMVTTIVDAVADSLRAWPAASPRLDVCARMSAITMQVITRTMFGDGITQAEIDAIARDLPVIERFTMVGVFTHGLPRALPVPGRRRFLAARDRIRALVARLIARQRAGEGGGDGTLLAMLGAAVDADTGARMSDDQILDEAVGIFLAGYDTTALALSWAIDLLMRHPAAMARLRGEALAVLGGRAPTLADLPALPYARQVLQEALRLYPSASWLPRVAVEDDVIDGVRIPAGTTVVLPIYLYHRHPACWRDPDAFDPDRFTPENTAARPSCAYLPFGAGARLCIGKELAMIEGQVVLAMLMQRFTFEVVEPRPPRPLPTTTLSPQGGVWARLRSLT